MAFEIDQNRINKTLPADISEKNQEAVGTLNNQNNEWLQINNLTPEEQIQLKTAKQELKWNNIVRINEILRNPELKKLLSPTDLKEAFQKLRSIHMEEANKHIDTANLGAVRDDMSNRLDTVATGYHELFKNLQGHIETTGQIHEESGENLVDLQNQVEEAEVSIQQLLKQLNKVSNTPTPRPIPIQDMSPSWPRISTSENTIKF